MSRVRELLGLPENAIAPRLGAAVLLFVHATLAVLLTAKLAGGSGTWVTALALAFNIACAWHRMWQLDWLSQVKRADAKQASAIAAQMFMPYSACPKCSAEQLHWIKPEAGGAFDVVRECRDCGHTWGQKVGA